MPSKTDKPFYYIAGSSYYQDEQIKKILDALSDCETEIFNPEDLSGGNFFNFINTPPLFSETKAALVKSFDGVKQPESIIDECAKCIESTIIITAQETKLGKKLSESLEKSGFNIIAEAKAKKYDLTAQIIRMFSEAGFSIDISAASELNELFAGNMALIKSEINKLTAFFAYKKPSSQTDILNAVTARKHDNIFTFIDAFTLKKRRECAVLLNDFVENGENLPILINLLFKRMKDVFLFGVSRELVKENRPFMLDKIKSGASAWNKNDLNTLMGLFAELDYKFKTGQVTDSASLFKLISVI